jgi:hypothetical protein
MPSTSQQMDAMFMPDTKRPSTKLPNSGLAPPRRTSHPLHNQSSCEFAGTPALFSSAQ